MAQSFERVATWFWRILTVLVIPFCFILYTRLEARDYELDKAKLSVEVHAQMEKAAEVRANSFEKRLDSIDGKLDYLIRMKMEESDARKSR